MSDRDAEWGRVAAEAGAKRLRDVGVRSAAANGERVEIAPLDAMLIADLIEAANPSAYRAD